MIWSQTAVASYLTTSWSYSNHTTLHRRVAAPNCLVCLTILNVTHSSCYVCITLITMVTCTHVAMVDICDTVQVLTAPACSSVHRPTASLLSGCVTVLQTVPMLKMKPTVATWDVLGSYNVNQVGHVLIDLIGAMG